MYVVKGFNSWMYNWKDKNWNIKIKHKTLWKLVYFFKGNTDIKWVKGHSNNTYNSYIDNIVQKANREEQINE